MRAVIIGGGIAGPAVAMSLQKVGIESVVLEARSVSDGSEGSYLTLSPNGLDALDHIDALPVALEAGFRTRRSVMLGSRGQPLGETTFGRELEPGLTAITVKRSLLGARLAEEAARRGTSIRHDARVVSVTEQAAGVRAELADGTVVDGDLLIGADGVHSRVRTTIDPAAPPARYVGLINFGGITRGSPQARDLPPETWMFRFARRAFFGVARTPADDVVWFVNVPGPQVSSAGLETTSSVEWQEELAELFAGDAPSVAELISTGELELAGDNVHDLAHVPRWHRGRMILIGDAAHAPSPSSGQGASMALEDAALLAASLGEKASVEQAFARYTQLRRRRVERIVKAGARSSSAKTPGPLGRAVRDAVLSLVFRHVVTDRSTAWLYDHRIACASQ